MTTANSSTPTTPISLDEDPLEPIINIDKPSPAPSQVSLHDLLLLSSSPHRRPKPRPRSIIVDDCMDIVPIALTPGARKKANKTKASGPSPRNARRARRRLEREIVREELQSPYLDDEVGRVRRKRQSRAKASNQEKLDLVASTAHPALSPSHQSTFEEMILELLLWKNAAKSTLWFGLGTIFFGSLCFSKDVSFSMISAVSHLGLLVLGLAFFYDSFPQRSNHSPCRLCV